MNKIQIEIIREMIHDRQNSLRELIDAERRKLRTQSKIATPSIGICDGLPVKAQRILESVIPKIQEYNAIVEEFNNPIEEKIRSLDTKYRELWNSFDEVKEKIMIKLAFSKNTMDEIEEILKLLPSRLD
jgi:hypothetical protein